MGKKLKLTAESCADCPYKTTYMVSDSRDTHFCSLTGLYVSINVANKTVHEMCVLEDD